MKKHSIKVNSTGLRLEPDGEYFRVWIDLGKDSAHFQATDIDNAIDILNRLIKK